MVKNKSTSARSKIGIGIIAISFIFPVFGLLVPFFGLNASLTTSLVAFFMVGGPEIFLILGTALAGKEGVLLVKNKIKGLFGLPEKRYPASKAQYETGIVLISIWFALTLISGYSRMLDIPVIHDNLIWWSAAIDFLLIFGIFGFGGHQMITKIGKVFTWEEWQLPAEKQKH